MVFLQNNENLLFLRYFSKYLYLLILKEKPLKVCKAEPLKPREKRKLILVTYPTAWNNGSRAVLKLRSRDLQDKLTLKRTSLLLYIYIYIIFIENFSHTELNREEISKFAEHCLRTAHKQNLRIITPILLSKYIIKTHRTYLH